MKKTRSEQSKKKQSFYSEETICIAGLNFKDSKGRPYFLPMDDGGVQQNYMCDRTRAEFLDYLERNYEKTQK